MVDSSIPPDWNRWLHVLSNINYDPATGVAPHKPLLLLVVCDFVEEGKLGGAILRRSGDLVFRFSSYWKIVAERRRTNPMYDSAFSTCGLRECGSLLKQTDGLPSTETVQFWRKSTSPFSCASVM